MHANEQELKENLQGATKHLATVTDGRAQETWAWQKKLQEVEKVLVGCICFKATLVVVEYACSTKHGTEPLADVSFFLNILNMYMT